MDISSVHARIIRGPLIVGATRDLAYLRKAFSSPCPIVQSWGLFNIWYNSGFWDCFSSSFNLKLSVMEQIKANGPIIQEQTDVHRWRTSNSLQSDITSPIWKRCNNLVLSWIPQSLSPTITHFVLWFDLAKDLWRILRTWFAQGDSFRMLIYKNKSMFSYKDLSSSQIILWGLNLMG